MDPHWTDLGDGGPLGGRSRMKVKDGGEGGGGGGEGVRRPKTRFAWGFSLKVDENSLTFIGDQ